MLFRAITGLARPTASPTTIIAAQFANANRLADAGPINALGLRSYAGPANPSTPIVPAFISIARRLADALAFDAGILDVRALSTTSAAAVVAADLPVAVRHALFRQ